MKKKPTRKPIGGARRRAHLRAVILAARREEAKDCLMKLILDTQILVLQQTLLRLANRLKIDVTDGLSPEVYFQRRKLDEMKKSLFELEDEDPGLAAAMYREMEVVLKKLKKRGDL